MFDTNVLLSASFTPGVCEVLLDICLTSDDISIILSEYILGEFVRHGVNKFAAPIDKVESAAALLRERCELVEPVKVSAEVFGDPDDLPVLGTAVAGRVHCLVTGDKQLAALRSYLGVSVVSPREFYDRVRT